MSLSFRPSYVSRPSVAPTTTGGSGTLIIAHRRINKLGQRSAPSPNLTSTSLPATLTPQTYSDTSALLRDEFIVSNDGGTTWRIIPSDTDHTGTLVVGAFDPLWPTTTLNATQSTSNFTLDFGAFNSSSEPSHVVYLVNVGTAVNSLTFNFVDLITQVPLIQLAGKIQVSIQGVYPSLGNNPNNAFNQSFIWDLPQISLNTVSLVLPQFAFVKVELKLLNYPIGNFSQELFNISLSVVANQATFPLTYPNNWPNLTFKLDGDVPFQPQILEEINATTYQVNPFILNGNGILRSQLRTLTLNGINGDRILTFSPSNQIVDWADGATIPDDHIIVATFTFTSGTLSNVVYPWPITPQAYADFLGSPTIAPFRFAKFDGAVGLAQDATEVVGVTLYENSPVLAQLGMIRIELGGTVAPGDLLRPDSLGRAIDGADKGVAIALESGDTGDLIVALLNPYLLPNTSGIDWEDIFGVPANLETIELWTADQVTRAGNIPSNTSGTIEKTGTNTMGVYTVTAAAKTVLDDATVADMRTTLGAAPLVSPAFTGTPTAPTAAQGTNTTQLATTAFVNARNLSTQIGDWPNNNYNLTLTTATPLIPTLITPTTLVGSGFSTTGFTVPAGQGGLYYFDLGAAMTNSTGAHITLALAGIRVNSTNFVRFSRISQVNNTTSQATLNLSGMLLLNAGDNIRPVVQANFDTGATTLGNLSFFIHRMTTY